MTRAVTLVAVGLLATAAALAYALSGTTATERMRGHLGIDANTTDGIRDGLLRKTPLGTPKSEVVRLLESAGFGADADSWMKRDGQAVECQTESDERAMTFGGAESHIHVWFEFDDADRLREVRVGKSLLRL